MWVALCSIEGDGGEDHELLAIHLHHVHWRVGIPAEQLGLDVLHTLRLLDLDQKTDIHVGLRPDGDHRNPSDVLLADREQPGKEKY